ncbi:hypothetical protein CALVIDRAFT_290315 [Calocera viscosa TUFC12733]|uniref:Uncharacterized protein n=1 Tax=Calocera viscosa (strain TUFC12733) TaxID=1330018 RepID=A0A167IR25_CALVF|nr:hypothetical protein CALVIDRAFT_290315 [Calocera viscosa TUFC12733]
MYPKAHFLNLPQEVPCSPPSAISSLPSTSSSPPPCSSSTCSTSSSVSSGPESSARWCRMSARTTCGGLRLSNDRTPAAAPGLPLCDTPDLRRFFKPIPHPVRRDLPAGKQYCVVP